MGVATEHDHPTLRLSLHSAGEHIANGLAGEVRQPIVARDPPLVPASVAKWRDMGEHEHMCEALESLGQHGCEVLSGVFAEFAKLGQTLE